MMVHNRLILDQLTFTLSTRRSIPRFRWSRYLIVEGPVKFIIVLRRDVMTYGTASDTSAEHGITCLINTNKLSSRRLYITICLDFILRSHKLTLLSPIPHRYVMIVVVMELLVLMNGHEATLHSRTMIFFKSSFSGTLWSYHIVNVMSLTNKLLHGRIVVMLMVLVVIVIKHISNTHIIKWHGGWSV